jgi:Na+/melibiose symporter-like transporter
LIGILWDAVNDLLVGTLTDRMLSRWVRVISFQRALPFLKLHFDL